jgi:hypothetical protein
MHLTVGTLELLDRIVARRALGRKLGGGYSGSANRADNQSASKTQLRNSIMSSHELALLH